MKNLVIFIVVAMACVFAGSNEIEFKSESSYKFYINYEEFTSDDYVVDANRRRGKKGMRGRRRGGGGLR
mgnify:CR=1 FL=1